MRPETGPEALIERARRGETIVLAADRRAAWLIAAAAFVVALVSAGAAWESEAPVPLAIASATLGVIAAAVGAAALIPRRLTLSPGGLTHPTLFSHRTLAWDEIENVHVAETPAMPLGRHVPVVGLDVVAAPEAFARAYDLKGILFAGGGSVVLAGRFGISAADLAGVVAAYRESMLEGRMRPATSTS